MDKFVQKKVEEWKSDLMCLSKICTDEPQVCYAAYVFALSKQWLYIMRTTPSVSHLYEPLEQCISDVFLPKLFNNQFPSDLRSVLALPARYGGLSIFNPVKIADIEYEYSTKIIAPLKELILAQKLRFDHSLNKEVKSLKASITLNKSIRFKAEQASLMKDDPTKSILKQQSEKGASLWLTTLPIENLGFVMNKVEFYDVLYLRYNLHVPNMPLFCACGKKNSVDHALCCMKGGFSVLRHNNVRDTEAQLLKEAGCSSVRTEEPLILSPSSNLGNKSCLDIAARGVYSCMERTLFDVRIFHPGADSYKNKELQTLYKQQ